MNYETILANRTEGVCRITLNRPACRNAMSLAMVAELQAALAGALGDDATRVIVLRGAEGNFCSGGDVADMVRARAMPVHGMADPIAEMNEKFGLLCASFAESAKPVIAVLEGAVIGGGFGLACVADVAIAHVGARFRLSETSLGLIPAQIAPFLVSRLGFSLANRLALTSAVLDGEAAFGVGLVHEIGRDDAMLDACLAGVMTALQKSPPGALAATKMLMRRAMFEPANAILQDAARLFAIAARGAEGAEGMLAFLEKRPPSWVRSG